MKRAFLLLALFVLLWQHAFSLSLNTNRNIAEKGQEVQFFGDCGDTVMVSAFEEARELFSEQAECVSGRFLMPMRVPMNLPYGVWRVVAQSPTEKKEASLEVSQSRESAFLLVVFHRPEKKEVRRKQEIEITVEITDSGKPVSGARVNFWGARGEKLQLKDAGNGFYNTEYEMPFDAEQGNFELAVAAEVESKGVFFGGESRAVLSVQNALVEIELLEPKKRGLGIGEKTVFSVSAMYNGIEKLNNPRVFLVAGDKNFEFRNDGERFFLQTSFDASFAGERMIKIVAFDAAGSFGEKEFVFVVQENPFRSFGIMLFVVIILAMALFLYWPFLRHSFWEKSEKKDLGKRREFIEKSIDSLKKRYYGGKIMDKSAYREKLAEMEKELREIGAKLN